MGAGGHRRPPFAETKEQIGGHHLMKGRDLDEAIALAGPIPTLPHGGVIAVRPVEQAPHSEAGRRDRSFGLLITSAAFRRGPGA